LGGNLKNYILRIYQYKKNNPHRFVGVVDRPDKKEKRAFTNLDELWDILNPGHQKESENMCEFQTPSKESRKYLRNNISYFTSYSLDSSLEKNVNNSVITNISKSGICLLTPEVLNKGENILIKCKINSPAKKATVRWSKKYRDCHCRVGLEFDN
jgi:hypothetical protein